jgi:hypothetical protein
LTSSEIREVIVRLFEAAREAKGAPYEPERLLAYLTAPPAPTGRRAVDSFAARRRFVRFMDSLQLELGICFTLGEWERGFGLEDLVRAAEKKLSAPARQLRLAEKRLRGARGRLVAEPINAGLAMAALLALPAAYGGRAVRGLLTLLWVAGIALAIKVSAGQYRYAQRLVARIASRAG